MTLEFLFYLEVCKASQGWIRTAAEPTAACGGNREARLGPRSDFSRPRQGAAEKSANATRKALTISSLCSFQRIGTSKVSDAVHDKQKASAAVSVNETAPQMPFSFCSYLHHLANSSSVHLT